MMKPWSSEILISIKPKWCELIFSGQKIDEIRRTKPNGAWNGPYTVYVWQTGNGGVVGKFTVRRFTYVQAWKDLDGEKHLGNTFGLCHCIDPHELFDYLYKPAAPGKPYPGGWAWRIEDPVKFDKPLPLSDFGLKRPPQSWQYVD
jgi:predicted transcriptional regulator